MNERAKARLDWKFEVAFGLLEVFDKLVSTVGAISLGQDTKCSGPAEWHRCRHSVIPGLRAQPVDILKIATFNINGIRSRLPALLEWLEREGPNVVCLQELKAPDAAFPINDIHAAVTEPSGMGRHRGTE